MHWLTEPFPLDEGEGTFEVSGDPYNFDTGKVDLGVWYTIDIRTGERVEARYRDH